MEPEELIKEIGGLLKKIEKETEEELKRVSELDFRMKTGNYENVLPPKNNFRKYNFQ